MKFTSDQVTTTTIGLKTIKINNFFKKNRPGELLYNWARMRGKIAQNNNKLNQKSMKRKKGREERMMRKSNLNNGDCADSVFVYFTPVARIKSQNVIIIIKIILHNWYIWEAVRTNGKKCIPIRFAMTQMMCSRPSIHTHKTTSGWQIKSSSTLYIREKNVSNVNKVNILDNRCLTVILNNLETKTEICTVSIQFLTNDNIDSECSVKKMLIKIRLWI